MPPCAPICWPRRRTSSSRRLPPWRPSWRRSAELEQAVPAAEAAQVAADEAEEARHRTAARAEALERALADLQGAGGRELLRDVDGVVGSLVDLVEIDEGWDAAFEAAIGAGVAAVVVDGRRSAQAALATLREGGVTGAILTPRASRLGRGRGCGSPRRAAAPSRSGATCGPARGDRWPSRCSTPWSAAPCGSTAGRRPSTSRWPATTSWWSRPRATASPPPDGVCARPPAWSPPPRSKRRGAGPRTRPARPSWPGPTWPRAALCSAVAATPAPRPSGPTTAMPRPWRRAGPTGSAPPRSSAGWPASSTRPAPRWSRRTSAWPRSRPSRRTWPGRCPSCRRRSRRGRRSRSGGSPCGAGARSSRCAWPVWSSAGVSWPSARPRWSGACRATPRSGPPRPRAGGAWRPRAPRWPASRSWSQREHERLDGVFESLRHDYQDQVDAVRAGGEKLERLRQDRHTTEQRLEAVRTRTRTLDLESNEVDLRMEALHEHIARDLGATPEELSGLPEPEAPEGTTLAQHAEELERKLVALGPVNPLALEELSTLEERHKELEAQVDDVRGARRELHEVVRTLDHEIMTSFAAAAADVNEHFSALIAMLFPGGTGRLMLVDPDDLLNTGVEIEVRPAGRNVRRVSLLSGGERSMAALAFLFAVFRSRPSPFYMMDEVEAALDDVNLSRFLALVHEFRDEAQLLIVSHQKRTMETGDALYGVTMAPGGSSQVVSQKVEKEKEPA